MGLFFPCTTERKLESRQMADSYAWQAVLSILLRNPHQPAFRSHKMSEAAGETAHMNTFLMSWQICTQRKISGSGLVLWSRFRQNMYRVRHTANSDLFQIKIKVLFGLLDVYHVLFLTRFCSSAWRDRTELCVSFFLDGNERIGYLL